MKHKITWQKCYDMESEIEYLGEENPGEHCFSIRRREIVRRETEGFWDTEEDECYYLIENHKVIGMGYDAIPSDEEMETMEKILMEKNII